MITPKRLALLSLCCSVHYALCAIFTAQQHSATCCIFGGGQECCCSRGCSFGRRPLQLVYPFHSHHFLKTTYLPTALRSKMRGLKLSHRGESFIKRPVKTSAGRAVRRLALNGQRGIRSVIYKLQAVCKHTSSFL